MKKLIFIIASIFIINGFLYSKNNNASKSLQTKQDSIYKQILSNIEKVKDAQKVYLIEKYTKTENNNAPWIVALLIGLITVFINIYISYQQRQTSINIATQQIRSTIGTKNRQEKINKLSDAISELISNCALIALEHAAKIPNMTKVTPLFEKYLNNKSNIIILLNPTIKEEANLINNLEKILSEAIKEPKDFDMKKYTDLEKEIISVSQELLRKEWNLIINNG